MSPTFCEPEPSHEAASHQVLVVCLRADGIQSATASDLERALTGVLRAMPDQELSSTMLAHVLRGSQGIETQELINAFDPPHAGSFRETPLPGLLAEIRRVVQSRPQVFALRIRTRRRLAKRRPVSDRQDLLGSIASMTADYRVSELDGLNVDHVDRWVAQFARDVQVPLLRELCHVLNHTYLSCELVRALLATLVTTTALNGSDPGSFWKSATFLDIQQRGNSQREMLALFGDVLVSELGIRFDGGGTGVGPFVYVDDVVFSGNRVRQDLGAWIRDDAPARADVYVLTVASHTYGQYDIDRKLRKLARERGKELKLIFESCVQFENRRAYRDLSEVLWPAVLPDDPLVKEYLAAQRYSFQPRLPAGLPQRFFSSERGRQLLEREFLLAGLKILSRIRKPKAVLRPLGFSPFGLGFGSLIVTYRNCPNNAPLALWWGETDEQEGTALDWYPLFKRKTQNGIAF